VPAADGQRERDRLACTSMGNVHADAADHLEVERKYEVPDDAEVPRGVLAVAAVHEHDLEAVYLDTADLALLDRGMTLRRRTGGADAGWHLKTPAGADARRETQHLAGPDGDLPDEVPPGLLDAVRAVVRDRELVPVAMVRNHRRELRLVDEEGDDLATICDDRVSATASPGADDDAAWQRWREWEIELAAGRPVELLDQIERALLAVGAEPARTSSKLARALGRPVPDRPEPDRAGVASPLPEGTAGAVLQQRLGELLVELQSWDAAVRADAEDGVHQMRVTCRRIRSVLTTAKPLLAPGGTDQVRSELRMLGQVLGRARDPEVLESRLLAATRAEPVELVLGPVVARIQTELHGEHAQALERVRDALGSSRYLRLLADLEALVAEPPVRGPGEQAARPGVARLLRRDARGLHRAVRAAQAAAPADRDGALHEVRKKAKRLRYAAELAEPVGGRGAERLRRRAKDVQQELGEHQDSVVARGRLRELAVRAHLAGENGFTFGLLAGTERLRAEEAGRRAERAWERLPKPAAAERWVGRG